MEQSLNTFLYLQVCHSLVTLSSASCPALAASSTITQRGRCARARAALCKIIARYRNNIRTPRQIRSGTWRAAENQVTTVRLFFTLLNWDSFKNYLLDEANKLIWCLMYIFLGQPLIVLRYFLPIYLLPTSFVDKYFPFSTTIGNSTRQVGFSEFE